MNAFLIAFMGGIGAALRFLVTHVAERYRTFIPCGTFIVNVTGSLLMGLLVGATWWCGLANTWHQVLGTGLLGGYTTFSTASVETVRLMGEHRYGAALLHAFGMLVCSLIGLAAGLLIMRLLG